MQDKETIPEHLVSLQDILKKCRFSEADDAEYANIGFALFKASKGDEKAFETIFNYIQEKHRKELQLIDTLKMLKISIDGWLSWATTWTQRKVQ